MPTQKYNFSVSNGKLVVTLDNSLSTWDNNETQEYRNGCVSLFGNKITLNDYNKPKKDFLFENIGTVAGNIPTNLDNAYALISALIPAV